MMSSFARPVSTSRANRDRDTTSRVHIQRSSRAEPFSGSGPPDTAPNCTPPVRYPPNTSLGASSRVINSRSLYLDIPDQGTCYIYFSVRPGINTNLTRIITFGRAIGTRIITRSLLLVAIVFVEVVMVRVDELMFRDW